jgi:8-oxo-dGTP pyrophosphatase MutT (NUDIX family)
MNEEYLTWHEKNRREVFHSRIFSIHESLSISPEGKEGVYSVIDSPEWVIIIPLLESPAGKTFAMVRQWRHGSGCLSLEFPGGVAEAGEKPEETAYWELLEETGYKAGRLTCLATMSPNPAIMSNRQHFFLAEDLAAPQAQSLDPDEYVALETRPVDEVVRDMGKPPYIHALMAAALGLYLRHTKG